MTKQPLLPLVCRIQVNATKNEPRVELDVCGPLNSQLEIFQLVGVRLSRMQLRQSN